MLKQLKRFLYVRAMIKSIESAREKTMHKNRVNKTDGLRVIKAFERVNGVKFNPFDSIHNEMIYGMANDLSFFRALKIRRVFK